ncbi:DUF4297 family anti-phage-associated protein [Paraherbaspirillum soli]|uniref:DUF4297 family anti-phage-associated protein n=1 Tax=Paraherbaspirillum soli TaxID=631222 RepID=A0ABW0M6S0_9BURK
MTTRSANAPIKGYFYQFDHTIVQILSAASASAVVTVEGIEDVDLTEGGENVLTQCKYYEGTEYNHSVIKDAVIHMLRHFKDNGCTSGQDFSYRVYGYYKSGQEKLPADFDVEFLKKHLLTYKSEGVTHEVHAELVMSDAQLESFRQLLEINIRAMSYDDQQDEAMCLLRSQIPGCLQEDAEVFYYPNAINVIQSLAIKANLNDRKISKAQFIARVNRKDIVFSAWLLKKFGDEYYTREVKKKHFHFPSSTKVPKSTRIFVLDTASEFDLANLTQLLAKIGKRFSHVENRNTSLADRFCPYVLVLGASSAELISLKENLLGQGIELADGHAFNGAQFSAVRLARPPTKDNLTQLKFIGSASQIGQVASSITGSTMEIFDFFKTAPLDAAAVPDGIQHNKIKTDTVYFINEVI